MILERSKMDSIIKIPLLGQCGENRYAIIDKEDYARLANFRWYARVTPCTIYVVGFFHGKYIGYMHRVIMRLPKGNKKQIDHINHNGLDNRKSNLRVVSHKEQHYNRKAKRLSNVKFVGVSQQEIRTGFRANLNKNGINIFDATCATAEYAALLRDIKAALEFKNFAYQNFPNITFNEIVNIIRNEIVGQKKRKQAEKLAKSLGAKKARIVDKRRKNGLWKSV
jgi:hypothetical protein